MSKSVIELLNEVRASEDLQKEAVEVIQKQDNQAMIDFLRKHDCDATLQEAKKALEEETERLKDSGELTPEELEAAAGGTLGAALGFAIGGLATTGLAWGILCSQESEKSSNTSSGSDGGC